MDISRAEQRVLHLLAQGGRIEKFRDEEETLIVECYNREGWRYPHLDIVLFRKLKRKRAIASRNRGPYRITRRGLKLVRSQLDNCG
ncbi:MAG: hypothetical protein CMK07_08845 [Ponticaulis sp.]|nr:hypothetical protein [Ponticaulis sp.]